MIYFFVEYSNGKPNHKQKIFKCKSLKIFDIFIKYPCIKFLEFYIFLINIFQYLWKILEFLGIIGIWILALFFLIIFLKPIHMDLYSDFFVIFWQLKNYYINIFWLFLKDFFFFLENVYIYH